MAQIKKLIIENKLEADTPVNMTATTENKSSSAAWYCAPAFLLFWIVLFFAVVVPVFLNLPTGLTLSNEKQHQGQFIAQRAEMILCGYDKIGPKVTGSYANENVTVQLLHDELEKIRRVMHHDLYRLEVDVQVVSGAYMRGALLNMYQGVQNFVVKLSCKNSTSENYLLINSHFDSKTGSPGASDDGAMVVIMLEALRVLATNRDTFQHPIVFLFNGAEENSLQGSHGFITQHKWAKNCKALINLDSAGSGNREMLFQSGPNHPWLIKIYDKHVVRPYGTAFAEELFQSNIVLSDTDFRIFRDYGHVPGLDFAYFYNGYVYHTEFDTHDAVPRGTLQATGDNILSLTKAFANAHELEDTAKYAGGHMVFYDFLGLFFISYTENQGKILNTCVSLIVVILVGISLWQMSSVCGISLSKVLSSFVLISVLHFIGILMAISLPILMAVIFDSTNRSMTWFTNRWLVLGLYVSPSLLGLTLPTVLYFSVKRRNNLSKIFEIQMVQHAHAVMFALLCAVGCFKGLRSSYVFLLPLLFYGVTLVLDFVTALHRTGYLWCSVNILGQVLPFIYTTYAFNILLITLIPMMGHFSANFNPDFLISAICAFGCIISLGFVMPIWNIFPRSKIQLSTLLVITFVCSMIAITPIGFPYRPKTNVGRVYFLNVHRVFYEYDGSVSRNESGYYFQLVDRRLHYILYKSMNFTGVRTMADDCNDYMMCGLPRFNNHMVKPAENGIWLPSDVPVERPAPPKLTMLNKTFDLKYNTSYFEFELTGPPHMSIFLQPLEGVTILDWPFLKHLLQEREKFKPPYHIYFTYATLSTPLKFHLNFKVTNKTANNPLFELGISGHYISSEYERGAQAQNFIKQFPNYVHIMEWPSSYERYIF